MFAKLPDASILEVPAPAPVLIPVVPFKVVPVMVFAVEIVPKPEAIEPDDKAPTVVKEEVVTPVPSVVADNTSVLLIWKVFPVAKLKVPVELTLPAPFNGLKVMFPVVLPPNVK